MRQHIPRIAQRRRAKEDPRHEHEREGGARLPRCEKPRMRLGPERPIILVKGEYPYQLARLNYLVDSEYVGKADPNPYHS